MPTETHFDSENLVVGSALVYYSPTLAAALPTFGAGASDPMVIDNTIWTPLGYTDQGIKFSYTVSNKSITVDEEMAAIDMLPDTETVKVSMALAELTLPNISRAIAGGTLLGVMAATASAAGTQTLQVGSLAVNVKSSILIIGNAPQGFTRMIQVYKALATSNIDFTNKRAEKATLPAEFTGMAYSPNPAGNRLFQIVDKVANKTGS